MTIRDGDIIEVGEVGPDVDLDAEYVEHPDGGRLTEARADQLAEEAVHEMRRRAGRPSVGKPGTPTPNLTVRVPGEVRAALESIAASQGRRLADVSRDALAEYADKHQGS